MPQTPVRICLLGGLALDVGGQRIDRFPTRKTASLLAFLALHPRLHAREALVERFWPEADFEAGRASLNVALSWLRRTLEPGAAPAGSVLAGDRFQVGLVPGAFETDVAAFDACLRRAAGPEAAAALREAASLYVGPLLPGFYDDWAVAEERRLTEAFLQTLHRLVACELAAGDVAAAVDAARREVLADPLAERAHADLMRALSASGQSAAALRHFEEAQARLSDAQGGSGSASLRRLADEIRRQPPPPSRPARTPALPAALTRFFGREDELADLARRLAPEDGEAARLVTLTGPGGTGKTRLAIEAARRAAPAFGNAVWFVALNEAADGEQLLEAIGSALRIPRSERLPAREQIVQALSDERALLVLDNFEQVVEDGARVARALLERLPRLTLLVTSRLTLEVAGEQEVAVAPLPTPPASGAETVPERLLRIDSVALFVDRARAVRSAFALTAENAAAVAELCARLEGIPLAIELAAARADVLTPAQMLEQLARRFDFLISRRRDLETRHRTLRGAIDWSFRLLAPELQLLFARLSVFRGGWSLEAAEAVCESVQALDGLEQLRQGSLVQTAETDDEPPEIRFALLETLREYAGEQLSPAERQALAQRHAAFFVGVAEAAEPQWMGAGQIASARRLEREIENLRAALAFSLEGAPEAAARLAGALWWFWAGYGRLIEGRSWLEKTLERYADPTATRARALTAAGALAIFGNALDEAQAWLDEAEGLFARLDDPHGQARCRLTRGRLLAARSEVPAARHAFEAALILWRGAGLVPGQIDSLHWLGTMEFVQCRYGAARRRFQEALALCETIGAAIATACVTGSLAMVALHEEEDEAARRHYEAILPTFRRQRAVWDVANVLRGLGCIALRAGDLPRAEALFAEASADYLRLGLRNELGNNAYWRARIRVTSGDFAGAREETTAGLALWRTLENPWWIAAFCLLDGQVALVLGDRDGARERIAEAWRRFREIGNRDGELAAGEAAAGLLAARGDRAEAADLFQALQAWRGTLGLPVGTWWEIPHRLLADDLQAPAPAETPAWDAVERRVEAALPG